MKTIFKSMMIIAAFGAASSLTSCDTDDDDPVTPSTPSQTVGISFKHMSGSDTLVLNTPDKPYTNALGQIYNVSKLRYLVSKVTLHQTNGEEIELDEYFFVDFSKPESFNFDIAKKIPQGAYSGVSYTFGFDEDDNTSGAYSELNAANWNWPAMLGGGYHFMQLEGQFLDSTNNDKFFATHMGTARKMDSTGTTYIPNHFEVLIPNSSFTVGNTNFELEFTIDINEWYTNPVNWDFNVYGPGIMPIYDAQRLLNTNGKDVFTVRKK
tara:strand:+ start:487 stop:1284 length:798 start_codon:yes stop_codon:yes gene_type:complete